MSFETASHLNETPELHRPCLTRESDPTFIDDFTQFFIVDDGRRWQTIARNRRPLKFDAQFEKRIPQR